jgi:hypothetical protein
MTPPDTDWCSLLETHLRTAGDRPRRSPRMAARRLLGAMARAPAAEAIPTVAGMGIAEPPPP